MYSYSDTVALKVIWKRIYNQLSMWKQSVSYIFDPFRLHNFNMAFLYRGGFPCFVMLWVVWSISFRGTIGYDVDVDANEQRSMALDFDTNAQRPIMESEEGSTGLQGIKMGPINAVSMQEPTDFKPEPPNTYKNLIFDFPSSEEELATNELLQFFIQPESHEYREAVQSLTIQGDERWANWTAVTYLFSLLPHLEKLHWTIREPISAEGLKNLNKTNPNIRIYLDPPFHAIIGSPLLYSLTSKIANIYPNDPSRMHILFDILRSNPPNLRELDMRILPGDGAVGHTAHAFPFRSKYVDETKMTDISFPPLEKLIVMGYNFEEAADGGYVWYDDSRVAWSTRFKWLKYQILPEWYINWMGLEPFELDWDQLHYVRPKRLPSLGMTSLDIWLKIMDWSHLHTFHINQPHQLTIKKLGNAGVLTGLKDFKIWGMDNYDIMIDFLENIASEKAQLTSLSIQNMAVPITFRRGGLDDLSQDAPTARLIDSILLHPRLKALSLNKGMRFSIPGLNNLLSALPELETLSIDYSVNPFHSDQPSIEFHGSPVPSHVLDRFKQFFSPVLEHPTLKNLEIHVPAPEYWLHQKKYVRGRDMWVNGTRADLDIETRWEPEDLSPMQENCEREEKFMAERVRDFFDRVNWPFLEYPLSSHRIDRLKIVVGDNWNWRGEEEDWVREWRWGAREGVKLWQGMHLEGGSAVWECWALKGEGGEGRGVECEGGRRWREYSFWN